MLTDLFSPCIFATVATTVANRQPLCYIHGKNEYVRNITWKQKIAQYKTDSIQSSLPSLATQDVQQAWIVTREGLR